MATPIIDLDELLGEDKQVKIRGVTYRLPPDLPVELYLRVTHAAEKDLTDDQMVNLLYDALLELFRYGDPKITELPLGVAQMVAVIPAVYSPPPVDGEGKGAERPTRTQTRGARSPRARNSRPKR